MKESFHELFEFLKRNRKYCPWSKKHTSEEYIQEVFNELTEVKEALKKKDNKNLQEEIGDVLFDLLTLAIIAEEEGKINTKEMLKKALAKLKERKPHVVNGKNISEKEALKIWYEVKEKQKLNRIKI